MTAFATHPAAPAIQQTKLFIDHDFVDAANGGTFPTFNPATGEVIAQVAEATAGDVDRAARLARKTFESPAWARLNPLDRAKLLFKLADLIDAHQDELAHLESFNSGKVITDARGDVTRAATIFRYYAGWADKVEGNTIPIRNPFFSYTLRQPIGVIGLIIPWNFPLVMAAVKMAPALATGNTVLLKPAEQTPLTALRLAELVVEAGFPPGVLAVLNGMGETTGHAIVTHPEVDKISFTGHVETAKHIQRHAAETLKRTCFELGGKSPNVVFADANLEQAVAGANLAIYRNGGQCCTAGSRLFVERSIHGEFVERLVQSTKSRRIGDPLDPATEQGPQVSKEQMDRILHYIELGQKRGAKLATGGTALGDRGYFIAPTVFDDVADDMEIAREEIFGPVVCVLPFDSFEEVIERANRTPYGLAGAIWTKNLDKAHTFARQLRAGTVWVNCYHVVDVTTPFGGFKQSGFGREYGEAGIELYTETKTVTIHLDPNL